MSCPRRALRCDRSAASVGGVKRADYKSIEGGTVINLGDLTKITDDDVRELGPLDVAECGSPCQGFSVAGRRGGLMDPRGMLTLAFVRLIHRMRRVNGLRYIIWENVYGIFSTSGNPFGNFLAGLASVNGRAVGPLLPPAAKWTRREKPR